MKARLPQGMGKGPSNNMNQMLKQAQKMQDEITALQADLEQREFTGTAGGGVVEVTINGKRNVLKLDIKPRPLIESPRASEDNCALAFRSVYCNSILIQLILASDCFIYFENSRGDYMRT